MPSILEVSCCIQNEKLHFLGQKDSRQPIDIDYTPPLGNGLGYTSLELLLLSLASCLSSALAVLLRRMGNTIIAFEVNAKGFRREQHPTSFEKIILNFTLTSPDATEENFEKALLLSEESLCPVWDMLKGNVDINVEYDIVDSLAQTI
jgi:putative redox protein